MADTATSRSANPESSQYAADCLESHHVSADLPESHHVSADLPESHHVSADLLESHNMPAKPESAHVMPAKPESSLVMPARPATPVSPAKMATMFADAPLWPGLIASVLDPPLVSVRAVGIPRAAPFQELAESAPFQEVAESAPEPLLVPPGSPEYPLELVPSSSPSSPLVPPSWPTSTLALSSSPSLLVPSSLALSEHPRDSVPPEHTLASASPERPTEVVDFPNIFFWGGGHLPTGRRSPQIRQGRPSPQIRQGRPSPQIRCHSVTNLVALPTHWCLQHTTTARLHFP